MDESVQALASYRHCVARIRASWSEFCVRRVERLQQQERFGVAAERVAEGIVEDLLTVVLDWTLADVNSQVHYADLLLTKLGVKYLIVETKRPGALAWNRHAVEAALDQARRYADEQKVRCIGVSDGEMLYAADIQHGGLLDRVFVSLSAPEPDESLWWLSVQGIYRPREHREGAALRLLPELSVPAPAPGDLTGEKLLHHKYKIPAHCFAYVGDANNPQTWKLPYRLADGQVDLARLPKAIQCILSNYRGARVSGVPERDIPDVLVRLAQAAQSLGRMPGQAGATAPVYDQLAKVLEQLGRLVDAGAALKLAER